MRQGKQAHDRLDMGSVLLAWGKPGEEDADPRRRRGLDKWDSRGPILSCLALPACSTRHTAYGAIGIISWHCPGIGLALEVRTCPVCRLGLCQNWANRPTLSNVYGNPPAPFKGHHHQESPWWVRRDATFDGDPHKRKAYSPPVRSIW